MRRLEEAAGRHPTFGVVGLLWCYLGALVMSGHTKRCHWLGLLLSLLSLPTLAIDIDALEQFDRWLKGAFQPEALRTLDDVRDLGELQREEIVPFPNGHSPGLQYRMLTFPGLRIVVVTGESGSPFFVESIELQSAAWHLTNGLAVGQPSRQLANLPVAANEDGDFCGVNHCLIVEIEAERIKRIDLVYYLD
jgi:hypothetical protein